MQIFTPAVNDAIRAKLTELGGRELRRDEARRGNEKYLMSLEGRRFAFCDLDSYSRFDEFVVTELRVLCNRSLNSA
jgi:hypothetical protein